MRRSIKYPLVITLYKDLAK